MSFYLMISKQFGVWKTIAVKKTFLSSKAISNFLVKQWWPSKMNENKQLKGRLFFARPFEIFHLSRNVNTHILHVEAEVSSPFAVKDAVITYRRHRFPLYCLRGYKTIFMFICPLSNSDILKTSNNTWLDQAIVTVQIRFWVTFAIFTDGQITLLR